MRTSTKDKKNLDQDEERAGKGEEVRSEEEQRTMEEIRE